MNRKEFIQKSCILGLGCLSIASLLESCGSIYYAQHTFEEKSKRISVKKSEFTLTKEGKNTPRKFVIIRNAALDFPIYLWQKAENEYLALYMQCTHKGCELNPHGDFLICPCHGAEFDRFGKVQSPPAEEDLLQFVVSTDAENVWIEVRK